MIYRPANLSPLVKTFLPKCTNMVLKNYNPQVIKYNFQLKCTTMNEINIHSKCTIIHYCMFMANILYLIQYKCNTNLVMHHRKIDSKFTNYHFCMFVVYILYLTQYIFNTNLVMHQINMQSKCTIFHFCKYEEDILYLIQYIFITNIVNQFKNKSNIVHWCLIFILPYSLLVQVG